MDRARIHNDSHLKSHKYLFRRTEMVPHTEHFQQDFYMLVFYLSDSTKQGHTDELNATLAALELVADFTDNFGRPAGPPCVVNTAAPLGVFQGTLFQGAIDELAKPNLPLQVAFLANGALVIPEKATFWFIGPAFRCMNQDFTRAGGQRLPNYICITAGNQPEFIQRHALIAPMGLIGKRLAGTGTLTKVKRNEKGKCTLVEFNSSDANRAVDKAPPHVLQLPVALVPETQSQEKLAMFVITNDVKEQLALLQDTEMRNMSSGELRLGAEALLGQFQQVSVYCSTTAAAATAAAKKKGTTTAPSKAAIDRQKRLMERAAALIKPAADEAAGEKVTPPPLPHKN
jgi:hypothetical protein